MSLCLGDEDQDLNFDADSYVQDTTLVILHLDRISSTRSLPARVTEKDCSVSCFSESTTAEYPSLMRALPVLSGLPARPRRGDLVARCPDFGRERSCGIPIDLPRLLPRPIDSLAHPSSPRLRDPSQQHLHRKDSSSHRSAVRPGRHQQGRGHDAPLHQQPPSNHAGSRPNQELARFLEHFRGFSDRRIPKYVGHALYGIRHFAGIARFHHGRKSFSRE